MTSQEKSDFLASRDIIAQRKRRMKREVSEQYNLKLTSGFTDVNGRVWTGNQEARDKLLELATGIAANDRLPKRQSSVPLRDVTGTAHNLTKAEIKALSEQAQDFKYDAETRRDQLYGQIDAATTHDELDAIDPTSGWPS
jgi:prophage tail gpP-like protein